MKKLASTCYLLLLDLVRSLLLLDVISRSMIALNSLKSLGRCITLIAPCICRFFNSLTTRAISRSLFFYSHWRFYLILLFIYLLASKLIRAASISIGILTGHYESWDTHCYKWSFHRLFTSTNFYQAEFYFFSLSSILLALNLLLFELLRPFSRQLTSNTRTAVI